MAKSMNTHHNAYSISSQSLELLYNQLKYLKSDRSTEVYEGLLKTLPVIIKIQYFTSKSDLNRKQEEAALQRSAKHPNICKCLKSYIDESYTIGYKFVMIMEKAVEDLDQAIVTRSKALKFWSEDEIFAALTSLIDALSFMQQNNLAHRDIKPANILIFSNNLIKLADFGLSIQEQELVNTMNLGVVGTVMYLSPVLMKAYDDIQKGKNSTGLVEHNPYKSDMYSLGLTFLYMASLKEPAGLNYNIEGSTYLLHKIGRAVQQLKYSSEFKLVLSYMLDTVEDTRLDFIEMQKFLNNSNDSIRPSFGISEIKANSTTQITENEFPTSLTLAQILQDPLLPLPIKSAINNISTSKALVLAHGILPVEAEYINIAIQENGLKLNTLDLSDCNLGHKALKTIFQADFSNLTNLALGNNNLGRKGAKVLHKNFEPMKALKFLKLWSNKFKDAGIFYLFQSLPDSIEELFLADNGITEIGAKTISRNLPKKLKILSLSENDIGDKGSRLISVALSSHQNIAHLYLDKNNIGPIGFKYLVSYLPLTVKSLRVIGNNINEPLIANLASVKFKITIN